VFVHISAVERAGIGMLQEGQKISYEEQRDAKRGKSSAENVKRVGACGLLSPSVLPPLMKGRADAVQA
jgi:hypothetical protein